MTKGLERLNALPDEDARSAMLSCCGSTRWAEALTGARPFANEDELLETADRAWQGLAREDWLEAFRSHPKIGERKAARGTGDEASRWSREEQRGAAEAEAATLERLARLNRVYEERFGHIFIVCATGRTAAEMLSALEARLANDAGEELKVAAREQQRITRLRLKKLLESLG
ncbi:MAG TPA: 2-oxo-4-hydroxy-4-carboxy-5-ureidoimidazoline decarboxylase [Pyrinomonadaceae bacterium]|nr:2-oxo-4-hydroxy-4-carboxy-5-ureidoimidazoline decarboxylase [Pyrinomonadaceae bacterium]